MARKSKLAEAAAEKSKKFETVKGYFDAGRWKLFQVKNAVAKDWITTGEYEEIVGEAYVNE